MHQTLVESPERTESLHIVYTSQLAPDEDYTAFGRICRTARQRNGPLAVSGVLLFDGQRFCQWLHGEPAAAAGLMLAIASDKRHVGVQTCLQALLPSDAFASGWRAGFVDSDSLDQFVQQPATGADQVLAALGRLLAAADIEPAMPQARSSTTDTALGAGLRLISQRQETARRPTRLAEVALHHADFRLANTGLPPIDTVRT